MKQGGLEVLTADLRLGMFVEDLDRPWLDTPFLIQGFLLDDQRDIERLRQLCHHVYVDPLRSSVQLARAQPVRPHAVALERPVPVADRAPIGGRPAARPQHVQEITVYPDTERNPPFAATPKAERRVIPPPPAPTSTEPPDTGTAAFGFNPLSRLKELFGDLASSWKEPSAPATPLPEIADDRRLDPSLAPSGVKLVVYADDAPIRDELPRAEKSFTRAHEVLDRLAQDMRTGTRVDVEDVDEVVGDMVDSMITTPDALMWIARLRQKHTDVYSHGVQVAVYLLALGRHLGFPKVQLGYLGTMGLLLDLGKTALPRNLLDKPGKLTEEEFELVKRHVEFGLEVVSSGPKALHPDILEGIAQHHERLNGLGYPKGLTGGQIGIYGRMAGIADCFAALTSPRPYAEAMSVSDAMMRLYKWGGEFFAQPLVEKLIQAIGVFPVGSLVELSTGEVAIVIRHNRVRRLQPTVLVIASPEKKPLQRFVTLDLLAEKGGGASRQIQVRRGLPSGAYGLDTSACYLSAA